MASKRINRIDVLVLLGYRLENGQSPTMAELAAGLGLAKPSSVQRHLQLLVQVGMVKHDRGRHSWRLTDRGWSNYAHERRARSSKVVG